MGGCVRVVVVMIIAQDIFSATICFVDETVTKLSYRQVVVVLWGQTFEQVRLAAVSKAKKK